MNFLKYIGWFLIITGSFEFRVTSGPGDPLIDFAIPIGLVVILFVWIRSKKLEH
jgi:hypothetical protein